jgi:hypothetical protein
MLGLVLLGGFIPASSLTGQDAGCPKAGGYACGAAMKVSRQKADSLLDSLRLLDPSKYQAILERYLGNSYGPEFNDWVVYIGKNGTVKQALIAEGAFLEGTLIRGGQTFFAVVFSDTNLAVKKDPARPAEAMEFSRATLQYTREPALTAFIKSITGGIFGEGDRPVAVPDTTVTFTLLNVVLPDTGRGTDTARLYVGFRRLTIPNNALVRFTLRANQPERSYDIPGATSVTRTIENASGSRFGASLGLGLTGDAPDTTFNISHDSSTAIVKSKSSPWKPNAWVLAHFYVKRPRLPITPMSVSVVGGTNVGIAGLFRDLVLGLSLDRLFGDVGVMGGVNFIERETSEVSDSLVSVSETGDSTTKYLTLRARSYRQGKLFAGLNFAF